MKEIPKNHNKLSSVDDEDYKELSKAYFKACAWVSGDGIIDPDPEQEEVK